ncbi:MAG TPA: NADH-quinone oxidoreductase subunit J [Coriobacteriia bacterium]|nr:NADH-quinone oxidoreductase subunit J [Coriobacteriia bacterium]
MTAESFVFIVLGALALVGAIATVFARDMIRMAAGLGAFFLACAAFFVYWGAGLLGVVQLFVYVGGVLVLMVFAIMLASRASDGTPRLESRHDLAAATAAAGLFVMVFAGLRGVVPDSVDHAIESSPDLVAETLLGPMLVQFEIAGVLLLAALVAVVILVGREDR